MDNEKKNEAETHNDLCPLNNADLIKMAESWLTRLINTGGRDWSLPVPANPSKDVDLIFATLIVRFKASAAPAPLSEQKQEAKYRIGRSSGTVILTTNGQTEIGRIHDAELAVKVCQYLNTL